MAERHKLALLSTGGTIAGAGPAAEYVAGALSGQALLSAVPEVAQLANWHVEECMALDSKDMQPQHWLHIAHSAAQLLARADIDGLVITHGTDTLEETAAFLDFTLACDKPVILTGAMRPASAVAADGPGNLLDAARLALHPEAAQTGVLVCFGEKILTARSARKASGFALGAFDATDGPVGRTRPEIKWFGQPAKPQAPLPLLLPSPESRLSPVETLHVGAGSSPELAQIALRCGALGLVLALPGNGSLPDTWQETVQAIISSGYPVVRASHCGASDIRPRTVDAITGSWPAGILSPAAARVALMLTLTLESTQERSAAELFALMAGTHS
jgi:L-asparaginase